MFDGAPARAGMAGSEAPAWTGASGALAVGAIGALGEIEGRGAGVMAAALGAGRSLAWGAAAAPAGLAALVLGLTAAERMRPPALVSDATVKLMSLTRSLAIGGNSTAEL
jgi:hypothetical protein